MVSNKLIFQCSFLLFSWTVFTKTVDIPSQKFHPKLKAIENEDETAYELGANLTNILNYLAAKASSVPKSGAVKHFLLQN